MSRRLWGLLPPMLILDTKISPEDLDCLEEACEASGVVITYDPKEAKIFVGRITQPKRAAFELRAKGVWTEAVDTLAIQEPQTKKRRQVRQKTKASQSTASSTSSEANSDDEAPGAQNPDTTTTHRGTFPDLAGHVIVVKLAWLESCLEHGSVQPVPAYQVYYARIVEKPDHAKTPSPRTIRYVRANSESMSSQVSPQYTRASVASTSQSQAASIFARAQADASSVPQKGHPMAYQPRRRFDDSSAHPLTHKSPTLMRTSTSEYEELSDLPLPEPPSWVKNHTIYACCRSTLADSPNQAFIDQLYKIKQARTLTLDQIGERAYGTSIASVAAYPYRLRSAKEVLSLPGCENKIAKLFSEWRESAEEDKDRYLQTVLDLEKSPDLKILRLFFKIWGVGAETARRLYFDRGFKDLDDVIEYGWKDLSRVQQIGLKYYDEFEEKISRDEVKNIAAVIHRHARKCRGIPDSVAGTSEDIVSIIVGGYRRGKPQSGDVDVILTHRDHTVTDSLVPDVIGSLENEGWITHTLILHTSHSGRGQATLPYRSDHAGHGFDSLDKGLVVWQDPIFQHPETRQMTSINAELAKAERRDQTVKNTNAHRRVDIIISPWKTIGCAVLGWSGATTFERDVRRWCKNERGWKFDSSGVRDRASGRVVDLEGSISADAEDTWEARERRLMEGLGIGWRPPTERCTG
ncbi:MAG: hypothetical protein Q9227_008177 [Pyrenula ochraceoflavens]